MIATTNKLPLNTVSQKIYYNKSSQEAQYLIDKVKRLAMLPRPLRPIILRELQKILLKLKVKFSQHMEVERFCLELARRRCPEADLCSSELFCQTECGICKAGLPIGNRVLFSKKVNRHICLACLLDLEYVF